jgi:dipeptidyl-peptidase 4
MWTRHEDQGRRPPRRRFASGLSPLLFCGVAALGLSAPLHAQGTLADYQRADQFLGWNARQFVAHDQVDPQWIDGDRFWFRDRVSDGHRFVLVDPDRNEQRPAFDHHRLAAALSMAADTAVEGRKLPFDRFRFVDGERGIRVVLPGDRAWTCRIDDYRCTGPEEDEEEGRGEARSPDGRWIAFQRDWNLWVRSVDSGQEFALTQDGEERWGYATNDQCCAQVTAPREGTERPPVLRWSPDSRRIAVLRLDQRDVEELHLLETAQGRPILHTFRYGLPGDSIVPTYDIHVVDVESRTGVRVDLDPQVAVNTTCCGLMTDTIWKDVRWGETAREVFFTRGQRDFQGLDLFAADAATGQVRHILREESSTWVQTSILSGAEPNWRVVAGDREVLWFSERDGWAHLYRYDASTGELMNRVTSGPWAVARVVGVVDDRVYFTAMGREEGRDPYLEHLYRVRLDGSGMELLTPEEGDHRVHLSPSGRYFVHTHSLADRPPVAELRRVDGGRIRVLAEAEIQELLAMGWPLPEPITVRARDGITPLRGLVFRPSNFQADRRYPVINHIYPGPQVGTLGTREFSVNPRGNAQALAELGFIVVQLDALGTPGRSKAFHAHYYGDMGDNGIPDHVAAMRELAARYPEMDLGRVGIYGHSGGGFASTGAILRYPDLFHAAVSTAGNHDNRSYDYTWGEKYQGVLARDTVNGTDNFDSQANHFLADRLEGALLLMHGTLDDNVHPNANLLLVDALIEHNKDFDLVVLPNRNHGFANEPYVIRRTWDHFVKHLLGVEPPPAYRIRRPDG